MSEVSEIKGKAKPKALRPGDLHFKENRCLDHVAFAERGTTLEDLLTSSYWLSVASRLHALDRICVVLQDRSAIYELLVLEASQSFVATFLLSQHQLPGILGDNSGDLVNFEIFFEQSTGYNARRLSDGVLVVRGATSRETCIADLKSHASFKNE